MTLTKTTPPGRLTSGQAGHVALHDTLTNLARSIPAPHLFSAQHAYADVWLDKPYVALRHDDDLAVDYTMFPDHRDRKIVAGYAHINKNLNTSGTYVTDAQALEMQLWGNQSMAHSRNHGGPSSTIPTTDDQFYDEAIVAAQELRARGFHLDAFVPPGPWTGDYQFILPSDFQSDIGRMIRAHFVQADGQLQDSPGTTSANRIRQIPAPYAYGLNHQNAESAPYTDWLAQVDRLIALGRGGIEFLTHLNGLSGTGGTETQANYALFLEGLRTRRDAGSIHIVTPTAGALAKWGPRINLLQDPSFEDYATTGSQTPWTSTSTITSAAGRVSGQALAVAASGSIKQILPAGNLRTVEVQVWAKGTTGASTLTIKRETRANGVLTGTASSTFALTAGTWALCRDYVGTAVGDDRIDLTFSASSAAGGLTIDDAALYKT